MAAASTAVVETRRFAGPLGALVGAVQLYLALRRGRQVRSRRRRIILAQLLQEGDFFPIPVHIARQDFYLNVVPRMTPERFRRRFRMCRACFDILVTQLAATPELCHLRGYIQPLLDMRKGIMIVLYRLSTLATVVDIAENWGVTESTVVVWTQRVTRAIAVHLGPLLIAWPNYLRREEIKYAMLQASGLFAGAIGCMDGSHIPLAIVPAAIEYAYVNRKGFHSMNNLAVCDHDLHFTFVSCGYPGSVADGRMTTVSGVLLDDARFVDGEYLLADSGFDNNDRCITPFKRPRSQAPHRAAFNSRLSSRRAFIERAFGRLKQRWRRLLRMDIELPGATDAVLACFALHNLCLLHDTPEHLGEPWWNRDPLSVPSIPGHEAVPEYLDIREDLANLLQEQDN